MNFLSRGSTGGGGGGLFSSNTCMCDITLDAEPNRKTAPLSRDKAGERSYIYTDEEDVCGSAVVSVKPGKKVDHQGVKVELIGQIAEGTTGNYDFFCISKDLEPPGSLFETKQYKWSFKNVDKSCETYHGKNVRLRYFVRLTVVQKSFGGGNITKEVDFVCQNLALAPDINNSIKMEVGIEECLHIEFEYEKSKYHLKDVIVGKIYFLLVRIRIKHMELNINRSEQVGGASAGAKQVADKETLTKFEIMDGAPVRDQCIPVRLYLSGSDLTPSYKNVQNKFSVKYFLSLVIVDDEDRRYFKQAEIFLYRKKIG